MGAPKRDELVGVPKEVSATLEGPKRHPCLETLLLYLKT
jgi:hypothetical protein